MVFCLLRIARQLQGKIIQNNSETSRFCSILLKKTRLPSSATTATTTTTGDTATTATSSNPASAASSPFRYPSHIPDDTLVRQPLEKSDVELVIAIFALTTIDICILVPNISELLVESA